MPERTYMGVDARKDHGFRIPRPDLSLKTGAPNACTQCHKQKTDSWAARIVAGWYPASAKKHAGQTHFSEVFAAAQSATAQTTGLAVELMAIAQDEQQPVIIRATAASFLEAYPSLRSIAVLKGLLKHSEPLIRYHAIHSLSVLIPREAGEAMLAKKLVMLIPLLQDEIRSVRTEAARALSDVPKSLFKPAEYTFFQKSLAEYMARQKAIEDRPEAHINMALVYQRMGQIKDAEAAYKTAIRLVPDDLPSRFNLANLYHAQGKQQQAEAIFREIIAIDAANGEAYYSLGLLLAELGRLHEAETTLGKAASLLPTRSRVRYNYALVLKKLGRNQAALTNMQRAVDTQTTDPMMVYVLATWLAEAGRYQDALSWAERLVKLVPDEDGAKHLLRDIRNRNRMQQD